MEVFEEDETDVEDGQVDFSDEDNALHNNQRPIIIDKDKENRKNSPTGIYLYFLVALCYQIQCYLNNLCIQIFSWFNQFSWNFFC